MKDKKFLITGATGQIARSLAKKLAKENTVHAIARFSKPGVREELEQEGVTCITFDYVNDDFNQLDSDYNYLCHLATTQKEGEQDLNYALEVNAIATGRLMAHFKDVEAFFFASTAGAYSQNGEKPFKETNPMGEATFNRSPMYPASKIAAEAVIKFVSRQYQIPAAIGRMNASYGFDGGLPVIHIQQLRKGEPIYLNPDKPNYYNPIFEDDILLQMLRMLKAATIGALVVNWCGSEIVSAEEWCEYIGGLLGVEPNFVYTDAMFPGIPCDTSFMHEVLGRTETDWREAMKMLMEANAKDARVPD